MLDRVSSICVFVSTVLSCACVGCGTSVYSLGNGEPAEGGDASNDVAADSMVIDGNSATLEEFCKGKGSVVDLGGGCGGSTVATSFRYAVCACDGYVSSHVLTTDSFDSTKGPYDPAKAEPGGSVGANGKVDSSAAMSIGGALWAGHVEGMTTNDTVDVKDELHAAGLVVSSGDLTIGKDTFAAGGLSENQALTIGGKLFLPSGAPLTVSGTKTIVGGEVRTPVAVPPPCDCDAKDQIDVPAAVIAHRTINENAAIGLADDAFANVVAGRTMTLPCGRYHLSSVGGTGALTLHVTGRIAIYVEKDFAANGLVTIDVSGAGEVDLFVAGNVVTSAGFHLGSKATPAKVRLWVGGNGTIDLGKDALIAGNVYAPKAEFVLAANTEIFGSVFVRRLSSGGDLTVHYDTSILDKGGDCPPPTGCGSCRDCDNQACIAGKCGSCTDSSQCCAPLKCQSGRCVAIIR